MKRTESMFDVRGLMFHVASKAVAYLFLVGREVRCSQNLPSAKMAGERIV